MQLKNCKSPYSFHATFRVVDNAVVSVTMEPGKRPWTIETDSEKVGELIEEWLHCLFEKKKLPALPLFFRATEFQKSVLQEIMKIPRGKTTTYRELGERVGRPKAYRAVANACGFNPLPLIIPCHRVIGSDGGLHGFAFGQEIKKELLASELN
jgi:methylated-DNA-[protein]-cysteine S-methyltransferase